MRYIYIKNNYMFKCAHFLFVFLCLIVTNSFGQSNNWKFISEASATKLNTARTIKPQKFSVATLAFTSYKKILDQSPKESNIQKQGLEIEIPYPDQSFKRFRIFETDIMSAGLAQQLPGIKTFVGKGIDDPYATIRLDYTHLGFHAFVMSPHGNVFIDPYQRVNMDLYISYYSQDNIDATKDGFDCKVIESESQNAVQAASCIGTQLRTYRLALACTGEYAAAVSSPSAPSIPLAASAMVTTVNRVVGVYEKEVAIRLQLINNNNSLIYLDANTDPYSNTDGITMLGENQVNITAVIGTANYDIGHVFSTGGGGVATLRSVCSSSSKSRGVTGSSNPVGDNYDIDYVAHEMGHQFGANHTFQSVSSNCGGGNRNASTAYEVGSGTTIMAYAGICTTDNIQPHSDPYFHAASYDEIINFVTTGTGANCAVITNTNNNPPTVVMPANNVMIPKLTPFVLTGNGFDQDGDAITYSWEEWDLTLNGSAWNAGANSTTAPLFKSRIPATNGRRYFPSLANILAGYPANPPSVMDGLKGETLPAVARTMRFRLTLRDNQPGGGGVASGGSGCSSVTDFNVVVTDDGPFLVTYPNTPLTWMTGSTQTVTWDVANTNSPVRINCQFVDILMSTDGGLNFNITLASNTPNDGSHQITVPFINSTTVRIMVKAHNGIFFDISNENFIITSVLPVQFLNFTAKPTQKLIMLQWATARELQNAGFEILRSEQQSNNFIKIGYVAGAANSTTQRNYTFKDSDVKIGVDYYYKLKQIDVDGRNLFSDIRKATLKGEREMHISFSPNPTKGLAEVALTGLQNSNFTIVVADLTGRILRKIDYTNSQSERNISINLEGLSNAVYFVKLTQNNTVITQKIIKQ